MSDYTKATNFTLKDGLTTGDPQKIIKGSEIDAEYNAIASAVTSKSDLNSPTFTGTPSAPTATAGTSSTQIATTAFVNAERTNTATLTNKTIDGSNNTISNIDVSTDITGTLPVANGGTGSASLTENNVILGNGTSAVQEVAPSTSGNVLKSDGTTWVSAALSGFLNLGANNSISPGDTFTATTKEDGKILIVALGSFESRFSSHGAATVSIQSSDGIITYASGTARYMESASLFNGDNAVAFYLFSGTANTTYTFKIAVSQSGGARTGLKYLYVAS